jgi:hypothetical protein
MSAVRCTCAAALALVAGALDAGAQSAARPAPARIAGTWRGTSTCTAAGKPTCHDETVVYRVRELAPGTMTGSASGAEQVEIVMYKIVSTRQDSMATLTCAHAAKPRLVACPMRGWTWTFEQKGESLTGTLANPTGVVWRNIRVTRTRSAP